ncbi:glycosyltransferase family 4 protein [Anabaena subtropica]|uniref:Glycosyltransferase family 4 protein n=1 Tax=Anabaena subtropica FACHB-260 TaxID=2692884 RepID=A0ABR8CKB1_9NOST|nr:glycosyltransferase family 4 protein [Anabaena subtropica]MBD2343419.1 glycosyltransferase family 4 protein [Anabaena subtropica FACHB-260]
MNVLHINQSDISGGAALAGYRLHQGLLKQGINSKLLVGIVKTDHSEVAAVPRKHRLENQLFRLNRLLGLNYLHLVSTFDILKHNFYQQADIINFHNLHTEYFNYLAIPALTKSKPAIFTLHDMWSFTGHCAYSYDCDRWQQGCGQCPYPETYPAIARDNTRLEWKLKNWVYSNSRLMIITPSQWLTEQTKKSMLNRFPIYHIPNSIDTDAYQPLNKDKCRDILRIPAQKKVLMFAADSLKDSRKGGDLLVKALQSLPESLKTETLLLTLGNGGEKIGDVVGIPTLNLGYVSSDRLKSIAYSAADLFIFPTRADNLPLVLQESMACGTPMVSFKIGGVPDLVRPGISGYLAQPEDTQDFCHGIIQLLENEQLRITMSENCRAITLKEYALDLQAKRYIEIYQKVLYS